jgi:hypothetical protein
VHIGPMAERVRSVQSVPMADVALILLGAVIGFAVHEGLGRGVRRLDRRRATNDPLVVHVETDPSIVWAGMPPWIGAGFLVPVEADISLPPAHCPEWWTWARARSGVDESVTQVRITMTARRDIVVVVDGLRVKVSARRAVPPWRRIICPVGGADITPRRAEVRLSDFDPPMVLWVDEAGDAISAPAFTLSGSDAEMIHLWAHVGDHEWVEWTAELLVLVDGRRRVIDVSDNGRPFVTSGSDGIAADHVWDSSSDRWEPPLTATSG